MIEKFGKPVLIIIGLASLCMAWLATQVRFDFNTEALFARHHPEVAAYRDFLDRFKHENEYLAIAIRSENGLFQQDFLTKLDSLTRDLEGIDGILKVDALTNATFLKIGPLGIPRDVPLVTVSRPETYHRDSAFLYAMPHFRHNFYGDDHRSTCIYLTISRDISEGDRTDRMLSAIQRSVGKFGFDAAHLSGGPYSMHAGARALKEEMYVLLGLCIILVIGWLWLSFRSISGVLLPLCINLLSVIWILGVMRFCEVEVNILTVVIPIVLFVVATSDVVHLLNRYREERLAAEEGAMNRTIRGVGFSTLLTSITTALGFLSLLFSDIEVVNQLGVFAAIGVCLAFCLTYTVLPPLLKHFHPGANRNPRLLTHRLPGLFDAIQRRKASIIFGAFALLFLSGAGASMIRVDGLFSGELRQNNELGDASRFVEGHFGGTRPFVMSIRLRSPDKSMMDPDILRQLDRIDHYLREDYGVNRMHSLSGNIRLAWCSLNNGIPYNYKMPGTDKALCKVVDKVRQHGKKHGLYDVLSPDEQYTRISGTIYDIGTREAQERNQRLAVFLADNIDTLDIQLTGSAHLVDISNQTISFNMIKSLGLALGVITLVLGGIFRSARIALITLITNCLPLLMIAGMMGWAGIGLNLATAIIFTIAFGIAVDDTIHFLIRFRQELKPNRSVTAALRTSFLSTGKAIILTSLIISGGFLTLIGSQFQSTYYIGLLISLTLIFALMADLLLLPVLLGLSYRSSGT